MDGSKFETYRDILAERRQLPKERQDIIDELNRAKLLISQKS